jgi:hypothetical protein
MARPGSKYTTKISDDELHLIQETEAFIVDISQVQQQPVPQKQEQLQ